ncbi:PD-(D/E)XK nuclease family protein [Chlamydiota bacterium]
MDNLEFSFEKSSTIDKPVEEKKPVNSSVPSNSYNSSKLYLSPSALNIFLDCPRCFWLDKKMKIKRPRGIFPSLPGGMDFVIKNYFDKYRRDEKMPPEIEGKVEGSLYPDLDIMERWRSWRKTELKYEDKDLNVVLSGALDDCLLDDGFYIPLDYKTRGSELKSDPRVYYQNQLDCYCLILEKSGFKTKNLAYLLYYWPNEVREQGMVEFEVTPIRVETDYNTAIKTVTDAANLLKGPMPDSKPDCEYCGLVENMKEL